MARRNGRVHADWETHDPLTWEQVQVELLMDIRDEMRKLNRVFACHNFQAVPGVLRDIATNTKKPRPKRRKKAA